MHDAAPADDPASDPDGGEVSADRYLRERLLGQGAMGAVHLVRDRETGERLALKKLFRMDGKTALRVKREFRALADLSHPNLVKVYELGRSRDGWFLAMEYLEGEDLGAYLARGASGSIRRSDGALWKPARQRADIEQRVLPAFRQLAAGVHALHRAGMLHRDLKPSNVLVAGERVVVLDFGLVCELDPKAPTVTEEGAIAGTPAYMAPEQVLGKALSERSDWYAFGTMLYEELTGELPFDGPVHELLQNKLQHEPPAAADLNPEVPPELSRLCGALLSRDPAARPSGREVLAELEPRGSTRPVGALAPAADPSLEREPETRVSSPVFFGRHEQLQALRDALHDTEHGKAVVAHVCGTSGVGKSVLVEQFLDQLDGDDSPLPQADAVVLRSRCYEREAMPFKALDGVIDALNRHLAHMDDVEVGNLLPTHIAALAKLFPVLERLRAVQRLLSVRSRRTSDDAASDRQRAEAALRDLFARLSARRRVVIWIDDLQWGDLDSARILKAWLEDASQLPLLIVLSYRSDEVQTSECLQRLLQASHPADAAAQHAISVTELAPTDLRALCSHQLGELADGREGLVDRIVQEAQGSPFLATQLSALARAKLLRGDADLGTLTIRDVVNQTTAMLPREARLLLAIVAVAGRPIQPRVALRAAGLSHGGRELVHALRRIQLVRTRDVAGERLLEVYHDRVRAAVQRTLEPRQLQRIHANLLSALEREGRADPDWLHSLALGAEERAAALRYGLLAAERAQATLAFERAAELYAQCLDLAGESAENRGELWKKLASMLAWCGRGAKAADAYVQAAQLEPDAGESVGLTWRAASHLFRSGRFEQGEVLLQRVLRAMGETAPETRSGLLAAIVWEHARARLRGRRYTPRPTSEISPALLARIDAYGALQQEMTSLHPLRGRLFGARHARLALESGEPTRVLQVLCSDAILAANSGSTDADRRTDELLKRAGALADEIGSPGARLLLCGTQTLSHWSLGRPSASVLASSAEALRLYGAVTSLPGQEANYHMRLLISSARIILLYELGEFPTFAVELRAALAEARATDNIAAQLHLAANETLLDEITGEAENAIARLERQRQQLPAGEFGVYHALHMLAVAHAACSFHRYDWGMRHFAEDWPRFTRSIVARSAKLQVLGRRARSRLLVHYHLVQRAGALRAAELESELVKLARLPQTAAFVHMMRARLAHAANDTALAVTLLRRALALPEGQASETILLRYALGALLGSDEGAQLVREAQRQLSERGVADPVQFVRGYFPGLPGL